MWYDIHEIEGHFAEDNTIYIGYELIMLFVHLWIQWLGVIKHSEGKYTIHVHTKYYF